MVTKNYSALACWSLSDEKLKIHGIVLIQILDKKTLQSTDTNHRNWNANWSMPNFTNTHSD